MSVLIGVPILDGVSEEDKTRDTTIDEADAEAMESGISCAPMPSWGCLTINSLCYLIVCHSLPSVPGLHMVFLFKAPFVGYVVRRRAG